MADISLSLPLTDIISSIIDPTVTPPTATVTGPPVTVTVTADPTTTTSTKTQTSSTTTSRSQSNSSVSTSTSATGSISTDPPEFLTTTYLTFEGTSLLTITALVTNPSARTHNIEANSFFSNRTAVIGVFSSIGVLVFAAIVAIVAWAARRRTLKRWQREKADKESFDRRNFLQDEMHDELSPSEKSWWASASGTSIPDGTGMPMRVVNSPPLFIPPVPPLPTELSPTATTFAGSNASKSVVTNTETIGTIPHPYGSPSYSMSPDLYQVSSLTHSRSITSSITANREAARSPPPSTPLPPLPYSGRGQDATPLPMILEGPPSATSTVEWASQIQPIPPPSTPTPLSLSRSNTLSPFPPSSSKAPSHPYMSPPTSRKSELYAEDVLLDLGNHGGIGRSLSGSRPAHPPLPTKIHPPESTREGTRTRSDFGSRAQTSTGHSGSNGSHAAFREASGSGISEGGWYDETPPDTAKAATGAAASGESVLGGNEARNNGFGYPQTRDSDIVSANGLSVDIAERRRVPHDPRFSGLFGAWADSTDERYQTNLQRDSTVSVDLGTEEGSHYAPRVLRVTNE